jgi:hypothetical protein
LPLWYLLVVEAKSRQTSFCVVVCVISKQQHLLAPRQRMQHIAGETYLPLPSSDTHPGANSENSSRFTETTLMQDWIGSTALRHDDGLLKDKQVFVTLTHRTSQLSTITSDCD